MRCHVDVGRSIDRRETKVDEVIAQLDTARTINLELIA
jgi:hypothetical protein